MKTRYIKYFLSLSFITLSILYYAGVMQPVYAKGKNGKVLKITNVRKIARVTGESLPGETIYSPNNTGLDYDVYGTDLGIMWHIDNMQIGLFFGDTSGKGFVINKNGGNGSNWRSNVVAFSSDTNLTDGLKIDSMLLDSENKAREICAGGKTNPEIYQTSIPTSAIRAGNLNCVHYMNIRDWGGPRGRWLTNFSSLYISEDGGSTWVRRPEVTFSPDSHFSQVAYAKRKGWIYMIGSQSGRGDGAYLARFREKDILDMQSYEYWNGEQKEWIRGEETAATPILRGPVGEASLLWHRKFKRWILTYNYDPNYDKTPVTDKSGILYCTAEDITQWSSPEVLYHAYYCAYMHPLKDNDDKIWFISSKWGPYNTFLMSADLHLE